MGHLKGHGRQLQGENVIIDTPIGDKGEGTWYTMRKMSMSDLGNMLVSAVGPHINQSANSAMSATKRRSFPSTT